MARIQSVGGLKQYILRKLGYPLHQIEITDEQLQDAIDDTLDDYTQFAYSGVIERYVPLQLVEGIQNYILPYQVFAVLGVYDGQGTMMGASQPSNLFSINQFIAADLYKPGVAKIDILGYEMLNQMISTLDLIFAKKVTYDFNSISKILHIHAAQMTDTKTIVHLYEKLNLTTTPVSTGATSYEEENIYDDKWVKRMATARAKLQWGTNIGLKYQGTILPNGGNLNGQGIIEMAQSEIDNLTTELQDVYQLPTDFFIG